MRRGATDPICGMRVDRAKASYRLEQGGRTYYFCSEHCMHRFQADAGEHGASPEPVTPIGGRARSADE
jgi:Cu+-exporting ATPase